MVELFPCDKTAVDSYVEGKKKRDPHFQESEEQCPWCLGRGYGEARVNETENILLFGTEIGESTTHPTRTRKCLYTCSCKYGCRVKSSVVRYHKKHDCLPATVHDCVSLGCAHYLKGSICPDGRCNSYAAFVKATKEDRASYNHQVIVFHPVNPSSPLDSVRASEKN